MWRSEVTPRDRAVRRLVDRVDPMWLQRGTTSPVPRRRASRPRGSERSSVLAIGIWTDEREWPNRRRAMRSVARVRPPRFRTCANAPPTTARVHRMCMISRPAADVDRHREWSPPARSLAARMTTGFGRLGAPRPTPSRVTTNDAGSPGSRAVASDGLPRACVPKLRRSQFSARRQGPSGQWPKASRSTPSFVTSTTAPPPLLILRERRSWRSKRRRNYRIEPHRRTHAPTDRRGTICCQVETCDSPWPR
jgi:hypothetical protein